MPKDFWATRLWDGETCHLRAARDYSAPLDTPPTRAQHIGQVVFSVRRWWQVILQSFESDPSLHTSRMTQHTTSLYSEIPILSLLHLALT